MTAAQSPNSRPSKKLKAWDLEMVVRTWSRFPDDEPVLRAAIQELVAKAEVDLLTKLFDPKNTSDNVQHMREKIAKASGLPKQEYRHGYDKGFKDGHYKGYGKALADSDELEGTLQ